MGVMIDRSGNEPGKDGAIHLYVSPEVGTKSWFDTRRKAIFVNGMDTEPCKHRKYAWELSMLLACPVTGVYNMTDGFWPDVGQCITDKFKFDASITGRRAFSFEDWKGLVDVTYGIVQKKRPGITREAFVRTMIERNPATVALYDLLQEPGYQHMGVPIIAHSQGNLITSNALTALALARGLKAIEGRQVYSYGSPCRFWPAGIAHTNNVFTFDGVGLFDLRMSWSFSKVGFTVAHSFLTYMEHDPEFVINRFRLGGWGMTFNMDEKGLAKALADMGPNADRLLPIFERLDSAHKGDSDDVVMHYLQRLRATGRESVLRTMAKVKPELIRVLIKILDDGWTTAEEKAAIEGLRKLLG